MRGKGQQRQYRHHPRGKPRRGRCDCRHHRRRDGNEAAPAADQTLRQFVADGCALQYHPSSVVGDESRGKKCFVVLTPDCHWY
ncbi:unnamed protein product [Ectocarpus sp. 13 AM-2016]